MKHNSALRRNSIYWGYLLVLPTVLGLAIFYIYPFFENIYNSFTEISFVGTKTWIGIENYKIFFKDERILDSFLYTFRYVLITVPLVIFLSIVVAACLNSNVRGIKFYRLIFYFPVIAMPVAMAVVWKMIFHTDFGLVNYLFMIFGLTPVPWLREKGAFAVTLVLISIWGRVGYNVLILLAGLQNIPKMYYEASTIDGAGPIKTFFSVTCPLLSPTIFFVVIINSIAYLQVFDNIFSLIKLNTTVGEANTSVLTMYYQYAFIFDQKGVASAISVVFFFVILLFTGLQFLFQKKLVHYEN